MGKGVNDDKSPAVLTVVAVHPNDVKATRPRYGIAGG
jgi:hypothetical protein